MFKKIEQFLPLIIIVSSLLMAIMIFFPALSDGEDYLIKGTTTVFGGELVSFGSLMNVSVNFNILNLLAYVLPFLLSIILFTVNIRTNKKGLVKLILSVLLLVSFLLSLIVFISLGSYTIVTTEIFNGSGTSDLGGYSLAVGAIISLVLSVIGIVSSTLHLLITASLKS